MLDAGFDNWAHDALRTLPEVYEGDNKVIIKMGAGDLRTWLQTAYSAGMRDAAQYIPGRDGRRT